MLMKSILLVCDRANIDRPLRRSLAHLVNSCQIEIAADGYLAFKELSERAFNLVIIDLEIGSMDGLELAESVAHIDPDVPVILMLQQSHRVMWGEARSLNANPILRPFKPLTFLRLVDTLLHQHLERFRELADALQTVLQTLITTPGITGAFLAETTGQVLLAANPPENDRLAALGHLAAAHVAPTGLAQSLSAHLLAANPADQDHELLVTPVLENLILAALAQPGHPAEIWPQIDGLIRQMQQAIYLHTAAQPTETEAAPPAEAAPARIIIPVRLNTGLPPAAPETPPDDEVAVNWAILTDNANTLNRLQAIFAR